ncbi:MAG: hypothetical protein NT131_04285 [Methanomassiliicoccales archaeon]|nr:hypothetical protein [Methanomassiliicoccales archaeon]
MVYDSVSAVKMTAKVAQVIVSSLKDGGLDATLLPVGDAKQTAQEFDCLIVGSPTMAWAPTKATMEFLDGLKGKPLSGRSAASFDTQLKSVISGNANKALESKLKDLGMNIAQPALQVYIKGKKDAYEFSEGELDKAASWGKELAMKLTAKV